MNKTTSQAPAARKRQWRREKGKRDEARAAERTEPEQRRPRPKQALLPFLDLIKRDGGRPGGTSLVCVRS